MFLYVYKREKALRDMLNKITTSVDKMFGWNVWILLFWKQSSFQLTNKLTWLHNFLCNLQFNVSYLPEKSSNKFFWGQPNVAVEVHTKLWSSYAFYKTYRTFLKNYIIHLKQKVILSPIMWIFEPRALQLSFDQAVSLFKLRGWIQFLSL